MKATDEASEVFAHGGCQPRCFILRRAKQETLKEAFTSILITTIVLRLPLGTTSAMHLCSFNITSVSHRRWQTSVCFCVLSSAHAVQSPSTAWLCGWRHYAQPWREDTSYQITKSSPMPCKATCFLSFQHQPWWNSCLASRHLTAEMDASLVAAWA